MPVTINQNYVVRLWCEWDLGQNDYVFSSKKEAYNWIEPLLHDSGLGEDLQQLVDDGLVGVEILSVFS